MNDVIFSTRGTKTSKILIYIFLGIILLSIAIISNEMLSGTSRMYLFMPKSYKRAFWGISLLTSVLPACCGTYELMYAVRYGLTYVDVYRDKVVGKGLPKQSIFVNDELFNIKNEQIINVTMIRNWFLCIHTVSGKYYIMTNQKTGAEIMNYYAELKG